MFAAHLGEENIAHLERDYVFDTQLAIAGVDGAIAPCGAAVRYQHSAKVPVPDLDVMPECVVLSVPHRRSFLACAPWGVATMV